MKLFLIIVAAAVLFVYTEPLLEDVKNAGSAAGILLGLVTLAAALTLNTFSAKGRGVVLLLLSVVYLALCSGMHYVLSRGVSVRKPYEVILVLGCRVRGDVPSRALQKRVDQAFVTLQQNPHCVAVLSGGQGSDELISEAECMRRMLVDRGIPESRLLLENRSASTDENIRCCVQVLKENGLTNQVGTVTSEYHQLRTGIICKKYGLEASPISSKTKPIFLPTFLLRELMALVNEQLFRHM